jgi:hypothetical protein
MNHNIRIFQGNQTRQINGCTGKPAQATAWYWEPEDYAGDCLWSDPYPTAADAQADADETYADPLYRDIVKNQRYYI